MSDVFWLRAVGVVLILSILVLMYKSKTNKMKLEKCLKCGRTIPKELRTCPSCYGKGLPDRFEKEVEAVVPKKVKRGVSHKAKQLIKSFGKIPKIIKYSIAIIIFLGLVLGGNKIYVYASIQSKINQAENLRSQEQFDLASKVLDSAITKNPTKNQTQKITKLKSDIETQKLSKSSYDAGVIKFNSNSWEEARDSFKKVAFGTKYFSDASSKISKCTEEITNSLRSKALELAKKYNVYWGESWSKRDKRSTEEILATYNELTLRSFIDKWENYKGGTKSAGTLPKTPTPSYPVSNTPAPPRPVETQKTCNDSLRNAKLDEEQINYNNALSYAKSLYDQDVNAAYEESARCAALAPDVFQSGCSPDYNLKNAKDSYDSTVERIEAKHKSNLAEINSTCY